MSAAVLRSAGLLTAARLVSRASGIVITALLARSLGDENFGAYTLCMSFALMFAVLAQLGVRNILIREMVRRPDAHAELISAGVSVLSVMSVVSVVATVGTAIALGYEDRRLLGIAIMSIAVSSQAFENLFHAVLEAVDRIPVEAGFLLLRQLVWILLAAVVLVRQGGYLEFLTALAATGILVAAALGLHVHRRISPFGARFPRAAMRSLARDGITLAISAILVDIYLRVDVLMLDKLTDAESVGHYGAAMRVAMAMLFLGNAAVTVAYPIFNRIRSHSPDRLPGTFRRAVRGTLLVLLPMCGILALASPFVVDLLYSEEYANASAPLTVLAWLVAAQALAALSGRLLVALDRTGLVLVGSITAVLLNLGLNVWWIPLRGPTGAALASLTTMVAVATFNYVVLRRQIGSPGLGWPLARMVGAVALSWWVARAVGDPSPWLAVPAFLGSFLVTALALRILRASDLEWARSRLRPDRA